MAATRYAQHVGKAERRPGVMPMHDYQNRRYELAARGQDLPQTKLLPLDVGTIRSAQRQRLALLKHIRDNLSNAALAKAHGVHEKTIEKVLSRQTHGSVA